MSAIRNIRKQWDKDMFRFQTGMNLLRRYRQEEDGNMSLLFAACAVTVIGVMGAAMDFSTLSNAKSRSQSIADAVALNAAVFVKHHERTPENNIEGIMHGVHSAYDLGYDFKGFVDGGAQNVSVDVEYDNVAREVRVSVSGNTVPTFIQLLGEQDLSFSAQSTAKFQELQAYDPASIVMVLDNSGSMAWADKALIYDDLTDSWDDPENVVPRIDALKTHANGFMTKLKTLAGDQSADEDKRLRTGMMAYNTNTITALTVPMHWDTITSSKINSMGANGGTNSAPPLDTARIWLGQEDAKHALKHNDEPLKFLIFMTDGVNTSGGSTWVEEAGTGQWYGERCRWRRKKQRCSWYNDTVESEFMPTEGRSWTEGKWESTANISSVADCTTMKNQGVKIFSIGFALAEGWYDTYDYYETTNMKYISTETRNKAYAFLSECASDPSTFLTAENAEELEGAFDTIGKNIAKSIIRLSN